MGQADTTSDASHAFLYSNGSMIDLGTLGGATSFAYGLNNNGDTVGYADTESNVRHAFLYSDSSLFDLNTLIDSNLGWTLTNAYGLNDLGQIVGTGIINGQTHAFVMTPSSVPVPAAAWLFGSGLIGLTGLACKRKTS